MSDPAALLDGGLRQPDRRSCGAGTVVAARMLAEPGYAADMTPARFAREVLVAHRGLTGAADAAGRLQLPWPRALGTPPWAVGRALSVLSWPGAAAARYVTRLALLRPGRAFDRVGTAVRSGRPVALYVGNRWAPRHVVLAVAAPGDLRVYDPSSGRVVEVSRAAVVHGRLGLARWDRLWFVVLPGR